MNQWGRERSGVYHSFFRAQATSCTRDLFCSRETPGASELRCPARILKDALTNFFLFTRMMPLPGGPWDVGGLALCKCGAFPIQRTGQFFARSALAPKFFLRFRRSEFLLCSSWRPSLLFLQRTRKGFSIACKYSK